MPAHATSPAKADIAYYDSVEVSLLTCQPHDEIYSLYGHTAIRYHDLHQRGVDIAFNYGVFNFHAPFFVARFIFGLTDYELGAYPFSIFQQEYKRFGSMVSEQVIDLTAEEKLALRYALIDNMKPENVVYRYNYFYNNCTIKARDIIERCIRGQIEYAPKSDYQPSYREMVHQMTVRNPWARFGNDVLLGLQADFATTQRQQEFLPGNLLYDFDRAQIYQDGSYRPLVKERRVAVEPGVQVISTGFPLRPLHVGLILTALGVIFAGLQWRQRRTWVAWDAVLMSIIGIFGLVLTCMLFSSHPTVRINLQFLLLNPLPWFYLWPVVRRRPTRYWRVALVLCILFLAGGLFQHYAEGIWSLALCLLIQCGIHLYIENKA